jgi:hypothetical protein
MGEQSHEKYRIGGSPTAREACRQRSDSRRGDHTSGCWMFEQFEQHADDIDE